MDGQPACSDPLNRIPDRLLSGEDSAYERAEGGSSKGTIPYEEALERELEYQKRRKMSVSQPPTNSSFPWTPSQKLDADPSLSGVTRTEVPRTLAELGPNPTNGQPLPSCLLRDCLAPPNQFEFQQRPMHQLMHQKQSFQPSNSGHSLQQRQQFNKPQLHLSSNQQIQHDSLRGQQPLGQPLGQEQQRRQLQPNFSLNQQPRQNTTHFRPSPFWCNICKVNCESAPNLKIHRQGRKHKNRLAEINSRKTTFAQREDMLWCKECNIPCMNEMALAQHLAGKKHMIQVLQANNGNSGAGMNMIYNG